MTQDDWLDDLPSRRSGPRPERRNPEVAARVDKLRLNPGKWAVVRGVSRNGITRTLQKLRSQYPDCEFQARTVDHVSTVYGRCKQTQDLAR